MSGASQEVVHRLNEITKENAQKYRVRFEVLLTIAYICKIKITQNYLLDRKSG